MVGHGKHTKYSKRATFVGEKGPCGDVFGRGELVWSFRSSTLYFNIFFANGFDMKDFKGLRTAFYMKKRCGSCRDSGLGWGPHICKMLLEMP